jgi:hypothetical protein
LQLAAQAELFAILSSQTVKIYLPVISSLLDEMEYIYNIPYSSRCLFDFCSQEDARHGVHLGKITDIF